MTPSLDSLEAGASALAVRCLDWSDQWWDDDLGLPWGPPGHEAVRRPRSLHLIPQAGWYAVGLYLRDRDDDRARALRIIDTVCGMQYDEPGTDWHGSYPIMAETPHPPANAVMWDDYDPNWRQFLGLSWVILLKWFAADLPARTVATLERAVRLGVEGEPPERCPPSYTNIALKRAAYESIAGEILDRPEWISRAEDLIGAVARRHDRNGAFEEFNSPTYYGVDLFALSLCRQLSPSDAIRSLASRLEADLWRSIAAFHNPVLGNLCAPFTRAYGMDMGSYVAKLMLPLRLVAPDAAPSPEFDPDVAHGHDLFAGAITALVGTLAPDEALTLMAAPPQRTIEQRVSRDRVATAWLNGDVMAGAEQCGSDLSFWDQYVAAAMHWATPSGQIGWLSVRMPGPSTATASEGRLDVPSGGGRPAIVTVGGVDQPPLPSNGRWRLPGIDLSISTALDLVGDGPFGGRSFVVPADSDVRIEIDGRG